MKRVLLVVAGALLGIGLFVVLLAVGERIGLLKDLSPPPYFQKLRGDDGRVLVDERGRELWGIDAGSAALVGRPDCDRRWCAREKDPGTLRVLSIGESTTFGAGYGGAASYSRFLEARLRRLLGRDSIEVVNCGKNGHDSHDWPTLVEELAEFAPDLIVVYVGHNELKKPNLIGVMDPAKARLQRSKLLRRLCGEAADELATPRTIEVGAYLAPEQRTFALELFERGLRALLDFGRDERVPVVVCVPASNVLDCKPRCSAVRPGADSAQRLAEVSAAGAAFESGAVLDLGAADADPAARAALDSGIARVERALVHDPDAAILHFRRGRMLLALAQVSEARAAFARSLALDGLPERASPDFVERTRALAREYGVATADCESRFAIESRLGVAGDDLFIDYCHPNLRGHWLIADEILHAIRERGLLAPSAAFESAREPGGSPDARFAAYAGELGISEARAAALLVEQAKLLIGNLGTRTESTPQEWRIPEEFLRSAERQDPALTQRSLEFLVLRAITHAALGDGAEARRLLLAAAKLDAGGTTALAQKLLLLPGLVLVLRSQAITVDATGFHWKQP